MSKNRTSREVAITYRSPEVWRRVPRLLLPALAFLLVGLFAFRARDRSRDRRLLSQKTQDLTRLRADFISRELETASATLLYLAGQGILQDFLRTPATRSAIEREYARFCLMSGDFDQLRLIDADGKEALRVNYNGGAPAAVPLQDLQSKADRYYFQRAMELDADQVYVSPIDLNQERGKIEKPWKPVLRLGTPVFDGAGERRGILVFNYLARRMLDRLEEVFSQAPGSTWMVNGDGYYLEGPDAERSWGFLFGTPPTFAADHPDAWAAVRSQPTGTLIDTSGMFTFQAVSRNGRIRMAADALPAALKVVSFVPNDILYEASTHTFRRMAAGTGVAAVLLLFVAMRLALVSALRDAHAREIAASEGRLRKLSSLLLAAQETERKSLARDLHDELGQIATAMTIDLQRARKTTSVELKDELIDRTQGATSRLLDGMHGIAARIRSSVLDDLGLKAALQACAEDHERGSGLRVDAALDFDEAGLRERVSENVYRIVQEALTNVARHSRAAEVSVRVWRENASIRVHVQDRGVGFDPGATSPDRLGVVGMRERAELLGGHCTVDSSPGGGTTVEATIPLDSPELEA